MKLKILPLAIQDPDTELLDLLFTGAGQPIERHIQNYCMFCKNRKSIYRWSQEALCKNINEHFSNISCFERLDGKEFKNKKIL